MKDILASFCSGIALDLMVLAQLHDRELTIEDIADGTITSESISGSR